jgi:hypothetical protein
MRAPIRIRITASPRGSCSRMAAFERSTWAISRGTPSSI